MKAILAVILALGLSGLPGARGDKVDPVGTWKCEYGGDDRTCTLTIKKDGEKITGTMSWPDQKETNLKDLKLNDGALKFSVVRKLSEEEFTFDFNLMIAGDKFKGKGETQIMGTKQEFDITGKREIKNK